MDEVNEPDQPRAGAARWSKVFALLSIALFVIAAVWSVIENGVTSTTLFYAAMGFMFFGLLYTTILNRPTKR